MRSGLKVLAAALLATGCVERVRLSTGDPEGDSWIARLESEPPEAFVAELDRQGGRADRWIAFLQRHPDLDMRRRARETAEALLNRRLGEVAFWSRGSDGRWLSYRSRGDGTDRRVAPPAYPPLPGMSGFTPPGSLRLRGPAVPSHDGRWVAFPAGEKDWDLYVAALDGSRVRRLTTIEGADRSPVWSPDDRHLAFISERDGDAEVYVVNVDTRRVRRITDWPGADGAPAWAADGRHVYFESDRLGRWGIYRFDLEAGQLWRFGDETVEDRLSPQ